MAGFTTFVSSLRIKKQEAREVGEYTSYLAVEGILQEVYTRLNHNRVGVIYQCFE